MPVDATSLNDEFAAARSHLHQSGVGLLAIRYLGYLAFHIVASPFLALRGLKRAKRRGYKGLILRRLLGGSRPPRSGRWTIIVAGGMGEVRTALRVAEELTAKRGEDVAVLIQSRNATTVKHRMIFTGIAPFNNPVSALLLILRWRPKNILVVEFWDNHHLKSLSRIFGIRSVVFNVPLTEAETERVLLKRESWRWLMVGAYAVQSPVHRERLLRIGVKPDQIVVTGPLALAIGRGEAQGIAPEATVRRWLDELRISPSDWPIVIAGSTAQVEEPIVVRSFIALKSEFPNAVLVMAPRDLQHRQNHTFAIEKEGLEAVDRKTGFTELPKSHIVVINTYGELKEIYSIGTLAFVGGTFDPANGGHTPVEALAWDLPITLGPNYRQQQVIVDLLIESGVAIVCEDEASLSREWLAIARSEETRSRIRIAAEQVNRSQENRIIELYDGLGLGASER